MVKPVLVNRLSNGKLQEVQHATSGETYRVFYSGVERKRSNGRWSPVLSDQMPDNILVFWSCIKNGNFADCRKQLFEN